MGGRKRGWVKAAPARRSCSSYGKSLVMKEVRAMMREGILDEPRKPSPKKTTMTEKEVPVATKRVTLSPPKDVAKPAAAKEKPLLLATKSVNQPRLAAASTVAAATTLPTVKQVPSPPAAAQAPKSTQNQVLPASLASFLPAAREKTIEQCRKQAMEAGQKRIAVPLDAKPFHLFLRWISPKLCTVAWYKKNQISTKVVNLIPFRSELIFEFSRDAKTDNLILSADLISLDSDSFHRVSFHRVCRGVMEIHKVSGDIVKRSVQDLVVESDSLRGLLATYLFSHIILTLRTREWNWMVHFSGVICTSYFTGLYVYPKRAKGTAA